MSKLPCSSAGALLDIHHNEQTIFSLNHHGQSRPLAAFSTCLICSGRFSDMVGYYATLRPLKPQHQAEAKACIYSMVASVLSRNFKKLYRTPIRRAYFPSPVWRKEAKESTARLHLTIRSIQGDGFPSLMHIILAIHPSDSIVHILQ